MKKQLAFAILGMILSAPATISAEQGSEHGTHHPDGQESMGKGK